MKEDRLTIENHHIAECGRLPEWARSRPPGSYLGYFENEYGEQWVLVATRDRVLLAGGDCGWDETYELLNPDWKAIHEQHYPGWPALILSPEERTWVLLCLATIAERYPVHTGPASGDPR